MIRRDVSLQKTGSGARRAAAIAALLVGAAASARADAGIVSPAARESLAPGAIVEVRWQPLCAEAGGREVDEAEIVLSLDGGRTFPVRVSPELKPCAARYLWRVPALPSAQARLAVRAGVDEQDGAERIEVVSADFRILAEPDGRIEQLWRHLAEWRLAPEPSALTAEDLLERRVGAPPAVRPGLTDGPELALAGSDSSLARPLASTAEVSAGALPAAPVSMPRARRASAPVPLRL